MRFEAPPGLRFTCTRCGDCCRSWNVMLGPGEEEELAGLDWRSREEGLEGAVTVVTSSLPGGRRARRLARRDDGACIYLGEDALCRIHRHFGAAAKPLMCRLYPFGFYAMGERLAVDASFACRSISQGSGAPVSAQTPEWVTRLESGDSVAEGKHRLTRDRPIPGELMWEIEHHLLGLLERRELSLVDRVRCCLRFVRLATTGDPSAAVAAKLRQAIAQGLPRQIATVPRGGGMDPTQRAVFYQWMFLSLNPVPVNFDLLAGPAQKRERKRRLEAAGRFTSADSRPWLDNRELEATYQEIDAVDASLVTAHEVPTLQRYLVAKIVGQRFLVAGDTELPLVEAVPLFLLCYPMVIWTSRALAVRRGAWKVSEEDLQGALVLLDRTQGQVPFDALPAKVAKAWRFVIEEMELVVAATNELVAWQEPEDEEPEEA